MVMVSPSMQCEQRPSGNDIADNFDKTEFHCE
jgi:hypothetical protein